MSARDIAVVTIGIPLAKEPEMGAQPDELGAPIATGQSTD